MDIYRIITVDCWVRIYLSGFQLDVLAFGRWFRGLKHDLNRKD